MSATMDRRLEKLMEADLAGQLTDTFEGYDDATAERLEMCIAHAEELRHKLKEVAEPIDDEDQLGMTMAVYFIELKARWIGHNTQMNFQLFQSGQFDPLLPFMAAAVSIVLAYVEAELTPTDIERINEFLAEPVS